MIHLTPTTLRDLAGVLANINRWELEDAGIVKPGTAGDDQWAKYNDRSMDVYILKLSDRDLTALCSLITSKMDNEPSAAKPELG